MEFEKPSARYCPGELIRGRVTLAQPEPQLVLVPNWLLAAGDEWKNSGQTQPIELRPSPDDPRTYWFEVQAPADPLSFEGFNSILRWYIGAYRKGETWALEEKLVTIAPEEDHASARTTSVGPAGQKSTIVTMLVTAIVCAGFMALGYYVDVRVITILAGILGGMALLGVVVSWFEWRKARKTGQLCVTLRADRYFGLPGHAPGGIDCTVELSSYSQVRAIPPSTTYEEELPLHMLRRPPDELAGPGLPAARGERPGRVA